MKKFLKTVIFLILFISTIFAADEGYDRMAREFSEVSSLLKDGKIAIVPFAYTDGRKSEGGVVISERLTTRIVKLKKLKVIERQMLEKVLQELHLESTGVVGSEGAKQIGKVLGVEAIITGTLMDIGATRTEINARMIHTETAEIIATSSAEVDKVWDGAMSVQSTIQQPVSQQSVVQQPVFQQPSRQTVKTDAFIDLMFGTNAGTMDLTFQNKTKYVSETDVGFNLDGNAAVNLKYKKLSFTELKTETIGGPVGLRFCGFPEEKHLGIGLELFYVASRLSSQQTILYADAIKYNFTFYSKDYLDVKTFSMSLDLFLRLGKKIFQPYIGFGIGMSINGIYSPYIQEYVSSTATSGTPPLNTLGLGFVYKIPYGLRVKLGKTNGAIFIEMRSMNNTVWFDRGRYSSDEDVVVLSLRQTMFGLDLSF
ncbi:MAG: FlgO family outer membrane protein [Endomicrobiia bacterium]